MQQEIGQIKLTDEFRVARVVLSVRLWRCPRVPDVSASMHLSTEFRAEPYRNALRNVCSGTFCLFPLADTGIRRRGKMASQYRLKAPIGALLDKPGGGQLSVTLPAGALLQEASQHSTTLLGMFGVVWEGRHYSVSLPELLLKAEIVQTA